MAFSFIDASERGKGKIFKDCQDILKEEIHFTEAIYAYPAILYYQKGDFTTGEVSQGLNAELEKINL